MVVLIDAGAIIAVCIVILYICVSAYEEIETNKKRRQQKERNKQEDEKIQEILLDLYTRESKYTLKELLESKPQDILLSTWVTNIDTFSRKYDIRLTAESDKYSTVQDLGADPWK